VDVHAADAGLPNSLLDYLTRSSELAPRLLALSRRSSYGTALVSHSAARMRPPVERPSKIICIGLNYRDHAAEVGLPLPTALSVFAKYANVLIGDGDAIVRPAESVELDYEAELAIIVGKRGRHIAEGDAYAHVAGYTIFNDVSVRDFQMRTSQWTIGKTFDTHGPCGPVLVTADAITDPHRLGIRLTVGNETLQDSNTEQMVFTVPRLIAELSAVMTLEPGDVIATGTPPGVGMSRTPRRWLLPGERVRIEIEGIGALENPVRAA